MKDTVPSNTISSSKLAEILGVDVTTVRRWLKKYNNLPCSVRTPGGRYRFTPKDVMVWKKVSPQIIDKRSFIGKKFGRLTVIKDSGKRTKGGNIVYLCKCECGQYHEAGSNNLRSGSVKSCGCLLRELASEVAPKYRRKYTLNEEIFDTLNEQSMYWIGFLMADGSIDRREFYTRLGLSMKDESHVLKFRDFLGVDIPLEYHGDYKVELRVASAKMVASLAKYGVVKQKTGKERVIGLENCRHFWRGLVDGDGHLRISKTKHRLKNGSLRTYLSPKFVQVGSKAILKQFSDYIKGFGVQSPKVFKVKGANAYRIEFAGRNAYKLVKTLYQDCSLALDRKLLIANKIIKLGDKRYAEC